jgi:hypothetical protein
MAQDDDFHEIEICRKHISNDTSQTAKKSTKTVPASAAVKMSPKAVLICNFFAPFRTTDMDMILLKQRTHYQSRRLPEN